MKFLVDFRAGQGLSQVSMAAKLGISYSFYQKIESGDRKPSRNFLVRFKREFPTFDMNKFFREQA